MSEPYYRAIHDPRCAFRLAGAPHPCTCADLNPEPSMPVPQPTPAALAALDLTPKGIACETDETEPRFWRCMCCEFCTDTRPAISAHYITTGHGYIADNAYADLLALLAAARRGAGDTEKLRERYREACEALARKHNNPECACVFCEDLRAARAAHPEGPQHGR